LLSYIIINFFHYEKQNCFLQGCTRIHWVIANDSCDLSDQKITGRVSSEDNGQPLAGVSILVKGKTAVTQSQENGMFSISVSEKDILQFKYVGYNTEEIPVAGKQI